MKYIIIKGVFKMKRLNNFIAKRIFDNYSNDMGIYFDQIQGQEEEAYAEILAIVENSSFEDKMLMLIEKEI
jgi:hypothetical protein